MRQSGAPAKSFVALSRPIRRDLPPASRTALKFIRRLGPSPSNGECRQSKFSRANRHGLLENLPRQRQSRDSSSNTVGTPPFPKNTRLEFRMPFRSTREDQHRASARFFAPNRATRPQVAARREAHRKPRARKM